MTITRDEFCDIVADTGVLNADYALDVLVRMAHHSAAIEGNTLTLSDTMTLLLDELSPSEAKPIRELYEVANHREAFGDVLLRLSQNQMLDVQFIKTVHHDLLIHIKEDAGRFKQRPNIVLGAAFEPAPPGQVTNLLTQWIDNANWQIENLSVIDLPEILARQHIEFEKIHPFSDGNGRTGRMILMFLSLKRFGVPIIINVAQRSEYISLLQHEDTVGLGDLFSESILTEKKRLERLAD
jgi:Fic family protein